MFQPGDLLVNQKYRVQALVGRGAYGEVYRATHVELRVERAIKVLRRDAPGLGSTVFRDYETRFELEARLGARLDDPQLVRVYDFERDGETLLLVMEYAAGGSLSARLERARQDKQPLPVDECIRIALEAAMGLGKLHENDIVHRDIKPSNLLFDYKNHVKVADLGLAQFQDGPSIGRSLDGSAALPHPGTRAYMSPEQENTTHHLTPAADVYALGCVLFEMLTNRLFRSQPPGTRAGKGREIPAWLDDLVAQMVSPIPGERPWPGEKVAECLRKGMTQERAEQERDAEKKRQAAAALAAVEKARKEAAEREAKAQARKAARAQAEREEAERQAVFEKERDKRRKAAEKKRKQKDEHSRLLGEARSLVDTQPKQALVLLAQIREKDPDFPELEKVQKRAEEMLARLEENRLGTMYTQAEQHLYTDPQKALGLVEAIAKQNPNFRDLTTLRTRINLQLASQASAKRNAEKPSEPHEKQIQLEVEQQRRIRLEEEQRRLRAADLIKREELLRRRESLKGIGVVILLASIALIVGLIAVVMQSPSSGSGNSTVSATATRAGTLAASGFVPPTSTSRPTKSSPTMTNTPTSFVSRTPTAIQST